MTTILIIDDDAAQRAYVREVAPPEWMILEASDGLSGLDLAREQRAVLQLVVLDMQLPDLEGRLVCLRLRELSATLPILPFTGHAYTATVLHELGCLPPIYKPVRPDELHAALLAAVERPQPPYATSSLIDWFAAEAQQIEQAVRLHQQSSRLIVYARSALRRMALGQTLRPLAYTAEVASLAGLKQLLANGSWSAIVAEGSECAALASLSEAHGLPLVAVASSRAEARLLGTFACVAVLDEDDPLLTRRLLATTQALLAGQPVMLDERHEGEATVQQSPPWVVQHFVACGLSIRESEVLWLDYLGYSSAQIARALGIDKATVQSHWKRMQRKQGLRREELKIWVQEELRKRV
jgi:DNA-binding NarL/FixJ family response regulator